MLEGDELAAFLSARVGKLTASRLKVAMSFKKDGTSTAERSQLIKDLVAERITGSNIRHFVTDAMQHGLDVEDAAKSAYEAATGIFLTPCGVYDHPSIDNLAATPDSLIGHDGLAEFKCPNTSTFLAWSIAGVVPEEHKPQMLCQMAVTGRKWCEFVAFDNRIRDVDRQLFIRRYTPAPEEIARIEAAAIKFLDEVDAMFYAFTTAAA